MINNFQELLPGYALSLALTTVTLGLGLPLGLLAGLSLARGPKVLRTIVAGVVEVGRGVPALVTLYLIYFGLPSVGIVLEAFAAVVAGFAFTTAALTADIFRTAITAIPQGQYEAAEALALGRWATFRRIVAPQALRIVVPPVVGFSVIVFQGTALAFSLGLQELMGLAYSLGTQQFNVVPLLLAAGVLYLATTLIVSAMARFIERRTTTTVPSVKQSGRVTPPVPA